MRLEESNQETDNGKQAADEWRTSSEGRVICTTARGSIVVSSGTCDGVLGLGAGESGILGSLDV